MNHDRQWLDTVGSEDSHGRALWAMGSGVGRSGDTGHSALAAQLFELLFETERHAHVELFEVRGDHFFGSNA